MFANWFPYSSKLLPYLLTFMLKDWPAKDNTSQLNVPLLNPQMDQSEPSVRVVILSSVTLLNFVHSV